MLPRFSLLSLILFAIIACLAAGYWQSARDLADANADRERLRTELGHLNIVDKTRSYVRQIPTYEAYRWSHRVYLPPDHQWWFHVRDGNGGGVSQQADPGEDIVTVSLQKLQRSNQWVVAVSDTELDWGAFTFHVDEDLIDRVGREESLLMSNSDSVYRQRDRTPDRTIYLLQSRGGLKVFFDTNPPTPGPIPEKEE